MGRPSTWDREQDATLRRMRAEGRTIEVIAEAMARTPKSISDRIARLKVPLAPREVRRPRQNSGPRIYGFWTLDRIATLRRLWAEGLSASQIAALMGAETRNVVLGKLKRLGLLATTGKIGIREGVRRLVKPKPAPRKPRLVEGPKAEPAKKRALHLVEDDRPLAPDPGPGIVRFLDRKPNQCAWPKWSTQGVPPLAEKMCCGHPLEEGKLQPYCAHHQRLGHSQGTASEQGAIRAARSVMRAEAA